VYDEAFEPDGAPRPHYRELISRLRDCDLGTIAERALATTRRADVTFGEDSPFRIDPVPRLIESDEWDRIGSGLLQRARALNRFVADAYGEREIVAAGEMPARAIDAAAHFEPELRGLPMVERPVPVIGFDLVRGSDGRFRVLEDNLRTPSGMAYAPSAREAVDSVLGSPGGETRIDPADCFWQLSEALAAAVPGIDLAEEAALVSDGPRTSAWFEHAEIGARLGLAVVTPEDLRVSGGAVAARLPGGELRRLRLLYRRTSEEDLRGGDGAATWLSEMIEPIRRGALVVVNAPGAGVADDKLTYAHVESMIRFYLGEEPILPAVRTYDPEDPAALAEVLERLGDLVVKPRAGLGGHGVVIGPRADERELELTARELRDDPGAFIAQEMVELSTHPTICGGRLESRHVDLRAFVVGDQVCAAALTRVAFGEGDLIVNSSRAGGAKDTWLLR
jgi:uncharacterized circularly permuted ATP-grasp superfamily protein